MITLLFNRSPIDVSLHDSFLLDMDMVMDVVRIMGETSPPLGTMDSMGVDVDMVIAQTGWGLILLGNLVEISGGANMMVLHYNIETSTLTTSVLSGPCFLTMQNNVGSPHNVSIGYTM